METKVRTISPIDGAVVEERPLATEAELDAILARAADAQPIWRRVPLETRAELLARFVDAVEAEREGIADELTLHMGRPRSAAPGEVRGFADRARTMIRLAPEALADVVPDPRPDFTRFIRREPLGVVLVLAPWNYPWLTAVNAIVPALLAGNVVVLKHSEQTPRVPERMAAAARAAGLPEGVFQFVHASHERIARAIRDPRVDFVAFTGSVEGGHAVHRAAADRFIATGLELGGKDPAYVRPDAPFEATIENLVDGAFFNSGQSCCAIERIYVHADLYERFVDAFVAGVEALRLGDPRDAGTTLGPVVRAKNARGIRAQIEEAIAAGARPLVDPNRFPATALGEPYLAPQVLVDVDHGMRIMTEETFGPVVGIQRVESDADAIASMNDSRYGLTASVWTDDEAIALAIGEEVATGTWFMNRCDYLDPELAWVGIRDSGRGCTLSRVGYEHLTRPKSFHLRARFG